MKVAVDFQSAAGSPTGIGVAAKNLVAAMREEAPDIEFLLYQTRARDLNTPRRMFWESAALPLRAFAAHADLLYSPGFAPAYYSPVKRVATVHDIIGVVMPANQRGFSKVYWTHWLPGALRRAERLVASSESTRRDLGRFLGISESRVDVVPLWAGPAYGPPGKAPRPRDAADRYGLRQPYFLAVSTLEPRKNFVRLVEAFARFRARSAGAAMLAIAGKSGSAESEIRRAIGRLGLAEHVKLLGYLPEEEIVGLYHGALGYVSLSLYEGFGLTALEAMSCGLSGIVSNRSSLPEVVGETALLVDPENVEEISAALERYARDETARAQMASAALARAGQFNARESARRMVRILRETAGRAA